MRIQGEKGRGGLVEVVQGPTRELHQLKSSCACIPSPSAGFPPRCSHPPRAQNCRLVPAAAPLVLPFAACDHRRRLLPAAPPPAARCPPSAARCVSGPPPVTFAVRRRPRTPKEPFASTSVPACAFPIILPLMVPAVMALWIIPLYCYFSFHCSAAAVSSHASHLRGRLVGPFRRIPGRPPGAVVSLAHHCCWCRRRRKPRPLVSVNYHRARRDCKRRP